MKPHALAITVAAAAALTGCLQGPPPGLLSDPPPDPEVQPLEIVVGNPDPELGPCLLNVGEVAAGSHDVSPVSMMGSATVRILDPSGAVIFRRALQSNPMEGGGLEVTMDDQGVVQLEAGDHLVECVLPDGTHTAELHVVPARPGYGERSSR